MAAVAPAAPTPQQATRRRIAMIVVVTLVAAWAGWTALRQPVLPQFVASGEPVPLPVPGELPAVSLEQFEGMLVGQQGRPVVVNVWASWCAPCRTEMPLLDSAARSYGSEVVILGVASKDDPAEAQRFLDDLGVTYANVFDESGQVRVALGLTAYPTTYVFGGDGRLRARVDGGISEQRLAGLVEDALR